jgi:putative component of toxin-antitoxin plasmid stabilization module
MIMDGVNNLLKKRIPCRVDALAESFLAENIGDVNNMGNTVEDLRNEELQGEMSYIFKDGVEGFIGESRSNS